MTLARRIKAWSAAGAVLLSGVGCSSDVPADSGRSTSGEPALGHVHGLGVDPADGKLYIASHYGVFRRDAPGRLVRVADRWQDTMAFTVTAGGHFLASGHPDLREDLPVQLGLIESTDAARTWRPVSLQGQADFHALEAAGELVYGYDAVSGTLRVTGDRERWRVLDDTALVDLAADAAFDRLLGTTPSGQVLGYRVGDDDKGRVTPTELNAPPLVLIDADGAGTFVGISGSGSVYRSGDAGESWREAGAVRGEPHALEVTTGRWFAATSLGIHESTDEGRSWTLLEAGS